MGAVTNYPARYRNYTAVAGTPEYVDMRGFGIPSTITVAPGASGSVIVATSTTPSATDNPGTATWVDWTPGTVTAATTQSLCSPVAAIRVTATTAAAALEIVG
jgi:hypothetical protein